MTHNLFARQMGTSRSPATPCGSHRVSDEKDEDAKQTRRILLVQEWALQLLFSSSSCSIDQKHPAVPRNGPNNEDFDGDNDDDFDVDTFDVDENDLDDDDVFDENDLDDDDQEEVEEVAPKKKKSR
ncbi:hypothetical protein A2U01_0002553 [Trifolium medium]|uniref:Uncharacterized protein n=1 Tax=Trifolium medium TaxID=97028 RepID=A0A392M3B3_9FABA|nr:hypothetical protein [Trifolium medium]